MSKNIGPPLSQSKVFLDSEGDHWFKRNKSAISSKTFFYDTEIIKRVLASYKANINSVLEIGCGNGAKLENICSFFNATGSGVDPSSAAIKNGNERFVKQSNKNLKLEISIASKLPYNDSSFDLVYLASCLHWVDRNEIFKVAAEADRVLKPGRFLVVFDFDPGQRHKRAYHHKLGLFTYKNSHSDFFTAGGHYYLVAKESVSHSTNHFSTDINERMSVCILYKEPDAYLCGEVIP